MLNLQQNNNGFRLVVARVEDMFEPGTFCYDVFGIKPGNNDFYALELSPWMEWLSFEVVKKCIEVYGATVVVAHSIYELTFIGYDANDVEVETKKEIEILKERCEKIENGTAKLISWGEIWKETGFIDSSTEEEKEQQLKQFKRINAGNKKIYEMLLP